MAATTAGDTQTRDRVLALVSRLGPVAAVDLATQLEITPTAVRRHLDHLVEAGYIEDHEAASTRKGRGRPARRYVLSAVGHQALADDTADLATAALDYLSRVGGTTAVHAFAGERAADLEARYADRVAAAGPDLAARVDALVSSLTDDGYAASARTVGDPDSPGALTGIQLCQGHCPVQHVATAYPQLCDAETEAVSRLLGVHVQRLATLAHGDHVCTTFVPTPSLQTRTSR